MQVLLSSYFPILYSRVVLHFPTFHLLLVPLNIYQFESSLLFFPGYLLQQFLLFFSSLFYLFLSKTILFAFILLHFINHLYFFVLFGPFLLLFLHLMPLDSSSSVIINIIEQLYPRLLSLLPNLLLFSLFFESLDLN